MLAQYIEHEAAMSRVTDGVTRRASLEASARKGNRFAIAALRPPPYPDGLDYLHEWFYELRAAGPVGYSGAAPLTHRDIEAWSRLMGEPIAPHEIRALITLDGAWRSATHDDGTSGGKS